MSPVRWATPFSRGHRNDIVAIFHKLPVFLRIQGAPPPIYGGSTASLNITEAQYSFLCCAVTFKNPEFHAPS